MWHASDWYETKVYGNGNGNLKMRYQYFCVPETLQVFTEKMLKKYTRNSIAKVGSVLLWGFHNGYLERDKLITSYGHQIIVLALASPLNSKKHSRKITIEEFRLLCRAYNGIKSKETSKIFLKKQTESLVNSLKNFPDEKTRIPLEFVKHNVCYEAIKFLLIVRLDVSQNSDVAPSENLIFAAYRKFKLLNEFTKGQSGIDFETQFGMDALSYFRSIFLIFVLGKDKDRNGMIKFETISVSKEFKDKYNHSTEKCHLFSSKLSCSDDDLTDWYKNILSTKEIQKYYPNILFDKPIINSKKVEAGSFLIPSPTIFLKRASNFLFSSLVREDESTRGKNSTMSTKIGDITEEHIKQTSIAIFGKKNVEKINHTGEKADFRITLDECILIIELKSSISGNSCEMYPQYCLMTTDYITKIWSLLYKACRQCQNSIDNTEDKSKPIITIVLIEDYIPRGVAALFQIFGEKSGLFKSLGMNFVHLFSWNHIEDCLSKTSILKFVTSLLQRQNLIPEIYAELLDPLPNLELDHENSAHSFNYFENEKNEILARQIS